MKSLHNKLQSLTIMEHLVYSREYLVHDLHKNKLNKLFLREEEVYDIKDEKVYKINLIEFEDSIHLAPSSYSSFRLFFPFKK